MEKLAIYGGDGGGGYKYLVFVFLMPIVGFRFRTYTDEQTLRALKAQLDRPLPVVMGKAGRGSGKPLKGWVAHKGSQTS